eukprot:scaffold120188_cov35-Attheya_sp.AAC.1
MSSIAPKKSTDLQSVVFISLLRAFLPLATTATDAETANDNDDPKTRAQTRAKQAKLHQDYLVPISFLEDAVSAAQTSNSSFNISEIGESFGVSREAYVVETT